MKLADILSPMTINEFLDQYQDKAPLYLPASESLIGKAFFDWNDFSRISSIMANWLNPAIRVTREGQRLDPSEYSVGDRDGGVLDTSRTQTIDMGKVHNFLAQGYTFIGSRLEYIEPQLAELARELNTKFNVHTTAHLFCSFKNIVGLSTHCDTCDVLVIQCEGEKRWEVFQNRYPNPVQETKHDRSVKSSSFDPGQPIMDVVLKKGDVLYLPKGFYHNPTTVSEASLHVTVVQRQFTATNLLTILSEMILEDEDFRVQLPDIRDGNFGPIDGMLETLGDRLREMASSDQMKQEIAYRQNIKSQPWHVLDIDDILSTETYIVLANLNLKGASAEKQIEQFLEATDIALVDRKIAEWVGKQSSFKLASLKAEFAFAADELIASVLTRMVDAKLIAKATQ